MKKIASIKISVHRILGFRSSVKAVIFAGLIVTIVMVTSAQELTSRPDRGFGGKGGYQTTEIDAISLQNGSVNVSIPLASLPPMAGGKLGYTLTANYNSKLWDMHRKEVRPPDPPAGCPTSYSTEEVWSNETNAGWRIGSGYELFFRDANDDYDYIEPDSEICYGYEFYHMAGRFFKPMLRTPDGAEHELRIQGYYEMYSVYGERDHMKGYYKQEGGLPNFPTFANPVRFYTIDGSYLTVEYTPNATPTKVKIYAKDGTRIEQSSEGERTTDQNGNSVLKGFNSTYGYFFARDEHTNREIRWSSITHSGSLATKIEFQSVGGEWQETIVVWGTTSVKGKVYGKTGWNPNGGEFGQGDICHHQEVLTQTDFTVIREIILPETESEITRKYEFEYNSDSTSQEEEEIMQTCGLGAEPWEYDRTVSHGWGELSSIVTPAGAEISYTYSNEGTHSYPGSVLYPPDDTIVRNFITKKELSHDDETDRWFYIVDNPSPQYGSTGTVINPDGSVYKEVYNGTNASHAGFGGTDGLGGLQVRTINSNGVTVERKWKALGGTFASVGAPTQLTAVNTVVEIEFTTLWSADGQTRLKMAAKKFEHDFNGEVKKVTGYDWFDPNTVTYSGGNQNGIPLGIPSGATILRVSETDYYNEAANASSSNAYQNRTLGTNTVILGKLKESRVGSLTTVKAKSQFSYDGNSYGTAPVKGNLTKSSAWDDVTSSWIDTLVTYTTRGNVQFATDANENVTKITYGSINGYTDLYPTQTEVAYGTSIVRTSTAVYDFYTGLTTSTTDEDNDLTNSVEYDILGRPVKIMTADGTDLESWTTTEYSDSNRRIIVRSDLESVDDGRKIAIEHYDQLGRVRLSRMIENSDTESPYNEQHGIKVETLYKYHDTTPTVHDDPENTLGTYVLTSNPFRAATASAATAEPEMGWTLNYAVNTGRHSEVTTYSGAALPVAFGGSNTNSTGIVRTDIDADRTLVTDQAGKSRISKTNALGQLKEVWEILAASETGSENVAFPTTSIAHGFKTTYDYDTLNNLTTVNQGSQTRTFTYSSLSRLLAATNPESGTISYQYDLNGNLTQKDDARGVRTNYVHDVLNRVTNRNYSTPSGTPQNYQTTQNVVYNYKTTAPGLGNLTKVESSVSTTEYTSFDILGRVTGHKQTTDGEDYVTNYAYNLSGALVEQTYPSGRKVKNVLDNNGDLSMTQSARCLDSTPGTNATCTSQAGLWNYAKNFTYNAAGAVTSMQLGNNRWESTQFNSRLQPTQIGLGLTPGATNLLKLDYSYGTTANNGNVVSQTITVPTVGQTPAFTAVQNYTYDSLNRLKSADEKPLGWTDCTSDPTKCWQQVFTFDRHGNRNFDEDDTTTLPKECNGNTEVCEAIRPIVNPSVNTSDNRLNGYTFDAAGNTGRDAQNREFTYDAENKQVKVETVDGNGDPIATIGEYFYDGDGKRIKKVVPSEDEVTVFVYNASGQLVAEYSTEISQTPKVSYTTADHLGSPRILTDENGGIISRRDFHPFGEEVFTSERSTVLGYQPDDVRQKFTTYERDGETDLDFAQARMHNFTLGRFNSPDPLYFQVIMVLDPQFFNLFSYVRNNPLRLVDPTGESVRIRGANTISALHEMVGGEEEFEKYFIVDGDSVWVRDGVDLSEANEGVQNLAGLVNAPELYLFYYGNDFGEIQDLFEGATDDRGRLTSEGRILQRRFEGRLPGRAPHLGYITAVRGRPGAYAQPTSDSLIFAIVALNSDIPMVQTGIDFNFREEFAGGGGIVALGSQMSGVGQRVRAASFFIHEGAEAQIFKRIGFTHPILDPDGRKRWAYKSAHSEAMRIEERIGINIGLVGGFSGGILGRGNQ